MLQIRDGDGEDLFLFVFVEGSHQMVVVDEIGPLFRTDDNRDLMHGDPSAFRLFRHFCKLSHFLLNFRHAYGHLSWSEVADECWS